jgi:alpha-beta hydrolase superfamily lysophospholipase
MTPAPRIEHYSAPDGRRLAVRVWRVTDPIAHVVYLHGIISHGGWYRSSCAHLASAGFDVHFLERRGSGLNAAERGDVDGWQAWLGDTETYLRQLASDRPRVLLGISWGGILAAAVARHAACTLAGIGLLCPGLFSHKAASAAQRAALRTAAAVGLRGARVTIPLRDPALFTDSPRAQQYIAADPLTLRRITIRFALANQRLLQYATERPEEIQLPVLVMLAGHDPITDNARVRHYAERIGHPDRRIIEYPGAGHTLEFEPDPSAYFRDLTEWCRHVAQE